MPANDLTLVPPAAVLFALAVATSVLPRRLGRPLAVAAAIVTGGWLLAVPAGAHLQTRLFGFDAVLFNVDPYSRLLGLAFALVAAVGVTYASAMDADRRQVAYALAYLGSGMGAAFAGDWLSLVVFWELMAVCATLLLWHRSGDRGAGIRYAIYHELGGLALIAGVISHYAAVGTFVFQPGGITAGLPAILVGLGIGLNAGFLGLHVWVVDAYPRTHVATSVVLAAVTTKVGAYTLIRAFPNGNLVIAYVGGGMVLFGVTFAILQTDMRRLLSYHIVSQVGYMVAGFGAGTALASAGAMAHLVNNILYKSLLFMVAGVLIHRLGYESLKKVAGGGRALPVTAAAFVIAAFSISGIPGFNGFISKGMVLDGVEKAGLDALWWLLLVGGVGTVISFTKFGYYAFLHSHDTDRSASGTTRDLRPLEIASLGTLAGLCLLFGLAPDLLFDLLPAGSTAGAKPFVGKQFQKAGAVTAAGLVVFVAIRTRLSHVTPVPDLDAIYHPLGRYARNSTVDVAVAVEAGIDSIGRGAVSGVRSIQEQLTERGARVTRRSSLSTSSIGAGILGVAIVLAIILLLLHVA